MKKKDEMEKKKKVMKGLKQNNKNSDHKIKKM